EEPIWKNDALWNTNDPDVNEKGKFVLQLILSKLPNDPKYRPDIKEIKPEHEVNYINIECLNRWFTCPALPYRISFGSKTKLQKRPLEGIENPQALAAYVDLIQTAEMALPLGEGNPKDPLDLSLWSQVQLGGQYLLGPDKQAINALVILHGKRDGYYIQKCWLVSDEEFARFKSDLSAWRQTLLDYCAVFVQ
ncbi:MAG: hypothetical protein ABH878_09530, partial [bacterium]